MHLKCPIILLGVQTIPIKGYRSKFLEDVLSQISSCTEGRL